MTHVDKSQMKDHMPTSQCTSKDSIYTEIYVYYMKNSPDIKEDGQIPT